MSRPRKKANRDLPLNLYYSKDTRAIAIKIQLKTNGTNLGMTAKKPSKAHKFSMQS